MSLPVPPTGADFWNLFSAFFIIGLVAGGTVVGMMVYWAYANRKKIKRQHFQVHHTHFRSRAREAAIIAMISTTLLFTLAILSDNIVTHIQYPPDPSQSLVIRVEALQWAFRFIYPNNVTVVSNCRIPVDTPVIFNVTSLDVMHDFGLPDFKVKIDAIPGRYNIIWIEVPSLEGQNELIYKIHCYELCGIGHTYMMANLTVMGQSAFDQWLNQTAASQAGG
jgi:cytochrome c oxidase subunit 2